MSGLCVVDVAAVVVCVTGGDGGRDGVGGWRRRRRRAVVIADVVEMEASHHSQSQNCSTAINGTDAVDAAEAASEF